MANLEYYHSNARKRYYSSHANLQTYWFLTIASILLALVVLYLFLVSKSGAAQIILALILVVEALALCIRYASSNTANSQNPADKLSDDMIILLEKSITRARIEGMNELTPEVCFDSFDQVSYGKMIFMRMGLFFAPEKNNQFKTRSNPVFSANLVNMLCEIGAKGEIDMGDFLRAVSTKSEEIKKYLSDLSIASEDVDEVVNWAQNIKKASRKISFWENDKVLSGVGQDWAYGYTPTLSLYSTDLSKFYNDLHTSVDLFGHQNKIDEIQSILVKASKNNCLLVGDPGVGKKTIINALALKLASGNCLNQLKYERIRLLDVGRILAGADTGEVELRLQKSFTDATSAGNIIIYIDNFQSLLGGSASGGSVGGVDASQALIPYLESSNIKIIASVTPNDYFAKVRDNSSVSGAFEKIDINPPTAEETLAILIEAAGSVEYRNNVFFPLQTLKKIVELSDRYIHEIPFPEKSIRLLEEAAVSYSSNKFRLISPERIEALVSKKVNMPVGQVQSKEKDKLLDLENFLHKRVIGQDEAITAVSDSLRRVRAGLTSGKRPAGVFLFLGPTGVGKTETAKALAESYFGSEERMIRLDMSEYQTPESIDRLVGTVSQPAGILTDAILENPFSLILLDEIEKADKNVRNLFLQVFEDGRLTDPRGRVSDFTNAIIIATSNAGSQFIQEKVKSENTDDLKDELIKKLQADNSFAPEFLNRFDAVIVFKPLTTEEIAKVAALMIASLNKTLEKKKVSVEVDPDALQQLVKLGYDPEFGARPMRRVIQQKVENLLAKKMLSGATDNGQVYKITLADIK